MEIDNANLQTLNHNGVTSPINNNNNVASPSSTTTNFPYSPYNHHHSFTTHTRGISSVKFSPDGKYLASASSDKTVQIYDLSTLHPIQTLVGHYQGISDISWSHDSKYLASAGDDRTIRIFSPHLSPNPIKLLRGHTNYVFCLNYNPSSNMIISGSFDESIRIFDIREGRPLKVLPAHSDPVSSVDFSADGTLFLSASYDGLVRVWDTFTGQCLKTLVGNENIPVSFAKFTPNGKYLLASYLNGRTRLWDYVQDKVVKSYRGHKNQRYCISAGFVVDDQMERGSRGMVVSGSEDCGIYVWDIHSRKVLQCLRGHGDVVIATDTHPKQRLIASGSLEGDVSVKVWKAEGGKFDGKEDGKASRANMNGPEKVSHPVNGHSNDMEVLKSDHKDAPGARVMYNGY